MTAGALLAEHHYDFGGIPLAITCQSSRLQDLLELRYGAFTTSQPALWHIEYRLSSSREPSPQGLADGRQQPLRAQRGGDRLRLESDSFHLELDLKQRTGKLVGPLATYPIDRMIQMLWYETWDRGLIVHGAAFTDGERGWLASGPSGSGKSTLAALFPEAALCDELAAVHLDDRPHLGSLPFWESRPGSAPLCGIYLLRHGTYDRRRRVGSSEAFACLRREIVWPIFDPDALRRTFESLADLISRVPIWELAFRPTRDVWAVISQEPEAA